MEKKRIKLSSSASADFLQQKNALQRAINQEVERAQDAESRLVSSVAALSSDIQKNSDAISNEVQRAQESELALTKKLSGKMNAKEILWGQDSNADDYVTQGVYIINGTRLNAEDGLPILNSGSECTVAATLIVADSTMNSGRMCVTQFLMLSNRVGSDGNMYMRTATGDTEGLQWGAWGKMQTNVEVGQVDSLNDFIDNGVYSGIYTNFSSVETFVMIVINNYYAAGMIGSTRSITQLKYALALDGTVTFKKRVGGVGALGAWSDVYAPLGGYSENRPANPQMGCCFFDVSLNKALWWNGAAWVDAVGEVV